jgi:hypothetical protein
VTFTGAVAAAVLTGLAAVMTAWAAVRRAKHEGSDECERDLAAARLEAEGAAAELHRLRMAHPPEVEP